MAHDWPNHKYRLNGAALNPPVKYGDVDDFHQLLSPSAYMCGVDLQDRFFALSSGPVASGFFGCSAPIFGATRCVSLVAVSFGAAAW